MNDLAEYPNRTISLDHISIIMPLISLMSNHFLANSFTLISDMETTSQKTIAKIASNFYLKLNSDEDGNNAENETGYIIVEKLELNFSRIFKSNPKIVVAVYTVGETGAVVPESLAELVIPSSTAFFVIPLPEDSMHVSSNNPVNVTIKCLRLYKPISNITLRAFPTMSSGSQNAWNWTWENEKMNWYSFENQVRKMNGVTIKIALLSMRTRKVAESNFWAGKYSFFWKAMEEHLQYRYSLLVRTPKYVHSWQSIFKPFSLDSWMCLAIFILLISVALRIATCWEEVPTADLSSCCLIIFGFVCSQGCPNMPRNVSSCVICYTGLLFSILIYQFYTSNFYSLLSTKEVSLPFTSLEDFMAKQTHSLHVHPETAIYKDIVGAKSGTLKALWDIIKKDPWHQMKASRSKKIYEKVCKGSAAILGLPSQIIYGNDLKCSLVPVNSGFFPVYTITALRKAFPFMSQFKYVHMRLKEAGITQKFIGEFFHVDQQHKTKTDVINEPVTLIHVCFLFALHVGSVILSLLILGVEIMAWKTIKRRKVAEGGECP